ATRSSRILKPRPYNLRTTRSRNARRTTKKPLIGSVRPLQMTLLSALAARLMRTRSAASAPVLPPPMYRLATTMAAASRSPPSRNAGTTTLSSGMRASSSPPPEQQRAGEPRNPRERGQGSADLEGQRRVLQTQAMLSRAERNGPQGVVRGHDLIAGATASRE